MRRSRFLSGDYNEELDLKEVSWINATGEEMPDVAWDDESMRCFGMLLDGLTQVTGIRRRASDATVLLVFNAHHDMVEYWDSPLLKVFHGKVGMKFNDPNIKPVTPTMTHFFYMDEKDPRAVKKIDP